MTPAAVNNDLQNLRDILGNLNNGTNQWDNIFVVNNVSINNLTPTAFLQIGPLNAPANLNATIVFGVAKSTGANNGQGISDVSTFTGNTGMAYVSFDSRFSSTGSNNLYYLAAFQATHSHASSGTLTNLYEFVGAGGNSGGTITNRKSLYIEDAGGAGTITNQYGIFMDSLTRGSSTNYSIYISGSNPAFFGGNIIIPNSNSAPFILPAGSTTTGIGLYAAGNTVYLWANSVPAFAATPTFNASGVDLIPNGDNRYNCGTGANRWKLVRGVTITPGDLKFENDWIMTEGDHVGHPEEGIMVKDPEGNLYKLNLTKI
jgi:hypothetical protein